MKLHSVEGTNASRVANPVKARMHAFLNGDNNGSELFAALYDHVAREPIPQRLRLAALILTNHDEPLVAVAAS
jgi:hypothetical protein